MFPILLVSGLCVMGLLVLFRHATFFRHFLSSSAQRPSNPKTQAVPRLSKDPALIQPEYDVVVIGSGYGGGVAASRMARTGKRVCLLERGAEKWPGEYPHTLNTALREYCVRNRRPDRHSSLGKESGLYQLSKGEGQDVFAGCGLGGTSLINAGVFLRADEKIFKCQEWPIEIRKHSRDMEQYYERSERMLQPNPWPENMSKPRKLSIFESQASHLGLHRYFYRPPMTVNFKESINTAGVQMHQTKGSGNECTGVNDGSKNSVLVTYLADAWNWGAEIFCGIDVLRIRKSDEDEGYVVYYELLDGQRGERRLMWVRARELVFLGAGAMGTTEILLRSRSHGLSASPLLGQKLSGNGDLLAFAYNCDLTVNSVGQEKSSDPLSECCGSTILGCVDLRAPTKAPNVRDGYVIQDGAVPEALGPVIQGMLESRMPLSWCITKQTMRKTIAKTTSWILGPYYAAGSVGRTAVYLVMGHDENEGIIELKDRNVTLQWSGIGDGHRNRQVHDVLVKATATIGGTLINAPCITVHPLGGACMSNDSTGFGGVVNHKGQLYCGSGQEVYDGIVCVDASIIPMSLGVNPCATITALAERCCDMIINDRNLSVDERSNEPLKLNGEPYKSWHPYSNLKGLGHLNATAHGLKFDEILDGFMCVTDDDCDFETAARLAETASSSARLSSTVRLHRSGSGLYKGSVTGTFSHGALSPDSLLITQGSVNFFTVDPNVSDAVNLSYNLDLLSTDGKAYTFHGYKVIDSSIAFSISRMWTATTTLHTTLLQANGTLVSKGLLRLSLQNFVAELVSMRCDRGTSSLRSIYSSARFLGFFARNISSYMLSPFRPLQYGNLSDNQAYKIPKARSVETWIKSADGVQICIKRWDPPPRTIAKETPMVLIPGASVDDQIFSLPTIPTNTIDYFTSQGYRCYVPVLRFGIGDEARNGWTVFDARLDVKATLQYVRSQENNKQVYAIVHCLGSIATAIALLHGDIEASWLCGMACSQVFSDLVYSKDNDFKAGHRSLIRAYRALAGEWFSCRSSPSAPWIQYLLDHMLRFYPIGSKKELCNSAVCHRCDVPFGRCWSHTNLNRATHARLGDFFDGIHMNFLTHLSRMGAITPHHVRSNSPECSDLVTPDNLQRLAGLKICFLSGGDNAVWQPGATKKSLDMLRRTFPNGKYERIVVQGYGHLDCWIGKDAYRDVYPRIEHHIASCDRSPQQKHACNAFQMLAVDDGFVNIMK